MPKMPELKNWDRQSYQPPTVDWDAYAYKDKQREKQRKQALLEGPKDVRSDTKPDSKKRGTTVAWSEKVEHKANKEVKRSKKAARREHDRIVKMTADEKEREAETAMMVEKIRQQQQSMTNDKNEVFEGFD
jgi:ATP-dependent RNA helicase DDX55/SPB4